MFRAIAQADLAALEKLSRVFIDGKRNAAALLALDHFFRHMPTLRSHTLLEMTLFLDKFRKYAHLIHDIISHPNPLRVTSIKRLFCIREISSIEYGMEPGSFLHSSATRDRRGPMHVRPSIVALSKREMITALRKHLAAHLCSRVTYENNLCRNAAVFSQCLTFIVNGQCDLDNCPQEHIKSADLDSKRYNLRIGIHLQQICILQLMYSVCQDPRKWNWYVAVDSCFVGSHLRLSSMENWLTRLYEAFKPHSHVQGSIADLDLSMIPGAYEGIGVMKHWVRTTLYTLRASYDLSAFLTTVLKLTSLIFAFDESSALKYVKQAHFNAPHARVQEFVYPDGRYALEDLVNLFDGTQRTCISAGLTFLRYACYWEQIMCN